MPVCHRHHLLDGPPSVHPPPSPVPVPHTTLLYSSRLLMVLTTAPSLATSTVSHSATITAIPSLLFTFTLRKHKRQTTHKEHRFGTPLPFLPAITHKLCITSHYIVHPSLSPTFPKSVDHSSGSFGSRPKGDLTTRHLTDTTAATTCQKTHGLPCCLQSGQSFCSFFCPPSDVVFWVSGYPAGSSCTRLPRLHWLITAATVAGKLGTVRHDRRETRWSTRRNQDRPRYMRPGHSQLRLIMIDPPRHIIAYPAS